ncbi:DUF4179 domain-containing protein [Brevibacillus brevis]|uniref:DUF4179 domain-containing protein n=1 Tax=Brevibacillus brevis TaxID=1393 RepID=UPI000E3B2D6B|nr:DUF4179 domain-containing protein [Brevibacillus brevis]RED29306.1 hypothetical protein DES34_10693 [Brevibacillus brevis]GEC91484.1 hypothetical protein BBR01nite_38150 [Brevibacillus brevis]VEF87907.1 Uncharacterised protein [Brevibacillus brevis]
MGGHAITVNEVYYDGTRFTIGYTLETKQAVGEHYLGSSPDLTANGKAFGYTGSSKHTQITPTLATGIVEIDAINGLPKEFKLGLSFHGEDGKEWSFSLPISSRTDTKRIPIHHQQQAGSIDLTVSDITMGRVEIGDQGEESVIKPAMETMKKLGKDIEFKTFTVTLKK